MIIDTHVHVVAADQNRYPRKLSGAHTQWVRDMAAETLLEFMDEAGIDRAMAVQAYGAYEYDNRYAADCALRYPDRFVSICILDPLRTDAPEQLTYWVRERGVRGLRLFALTQPDSEWIDDPRTFPLWERAASLGIPLCVCLKFRQVSRLRVALERFPSVPVALDHLGGPRLAEGPPYEAVQPLFELARFANLYLKFSSVSLYGAATGKSTPGEFFRRLLDIFGPDRLMWGSNFPATYDRGLMEQLNLARKELSFLSGRDRSKLFAGTSQVLWPSLR
jgi:predicted TIM-barrel fold metal-dependent hydrolase